MEGLEDSHTELKLRGGANHVTVLALEAVPQPPPSIRTRVIVSISGFSGQKDGIYLELEAFNRFLEQLEALEGSRQGSACLSAMSPGEFELRLETEDRAGHLRCEVTLARLVEPVRLSGIFDVDTEWLARVVEEARRLRDFGKSGG